MDTRECKWTTTKFVIIYRTPYSEAHPVSANVFFEEFAGCLESIIVCHENLVIDGDFNFHLHDLLDHDAMKFTELLETFGLENHVSFPTHINGHWLDLIITRSTNDIKVLSPVSSLYLSDHCFVECSLTIPTPYPTIKEISFQKWKNIDLDVLENDILESDLYSLTDDQLSVNYHRILQGILHDHAPLQNKTLVAQPRVPWYCDALYQIKRNCRKFEKKMRKTNLPTDVAKYHKARNHYCAKLRDAKRTYYTNLIQESSGDSKKLFQIVNLLCKERNNNMLPPHSDSLQLANDFGDYLCRKITLIQEEIQQCNIPPPSFTVPCPSSLLKRFKTVTQDDLSELIMSSSNATCRLDPAPTWLMKDCVNELSPIFTQIINFSLTSGSVPSIWKSALVVPLPKKTGLELTFNNFRPVSNLSLISKVGEKVVIPQILDHCCDHAPLPSHQSAYHQHHSTETALLKVHNDILLNMENKR